MVDLFSESLANPDNLSYSFRIYHNSRDHQPHLGVLHRRLETVCHNSWP